MLDFGVATWTLAADTMRAQPGSPGGWAVGTPYYLSLEQAAAMNDLYAPTLIMERAESSFRAVGSRQSRPRPPRRRLRREREATDGDPATLVRNEARDGRASQRHGVAAAGGPEEDTATTLVVRRAGRRRSP